jgi:hypothetical protein
MREIYVETGKWLLCFAAVADESRIGLCCPKMLQLLIPSKLILSPGALIFDITLVRRLIHCIILPYFPLCLCVYVFV